MQDPLVDHTSIRWAIQRRDRKLWRMKAKHTKQWEALFQRRIWEQLMWWRVTTTTNRSDISLELSMGCMTSRRLNTALRSSSPLIRVITQIRQRRWFWGSSRTTFKPQRNGLTLNQFRWRNQIRPSSRKRLSSLRKTSISWESINREKLSTEGSFLNLGKPRSSLIG